MEKICENCKWLDTDPFDGGLVCVNKDSPYCAELWCRPDDCCEHWEPFILTCEYCRWCQADVTIEQRVDGTRVTRNICEKHKWYVPLDGHCHMGERRSNEKKIR